MARFQVPGVPDASLRPKLADTVEGVTPGRGVRVEGGRASSERQTLDGEFAEVVLTGGVRLWGRTEILNEDLGDHTSRAAGTGPPVWKVRLGRGPGARGAGKDLAVEAVQTFELQIVGAIRDLIESRVEKGKQTGGLLQQCVPSSPSAFNTAASVVGNGPALVFIHGTASSTDGSFGGLWEAVGANRVLKIENPGARINGLFKAYEGRIFAFDHRSLSESPIVNAAALMKQLAEVVPGGRELHLVSHSRGGMIGELLCRGMRREGPPIDAIDFGLFPDDEERSRDRKALQELDRLLTAQRYRIGRFVRVACPAAGTTLADERLDRYVSLLVNVAGTLTGLGADPMYQALTNLLAAVLKERTKPQELPGLEAMMPRSPLARMLNRRDVITTADLHVLGGDLAVRGVWSALKALATDFFFLEDHDLVVNTPSMLRGTPRASTVKYFVDTDGDVSHFNYFRRADTAERLATFLSTGAGQFRDLEVAPHEVDGNSYQKRDGASRPTLLLVPGFMGSHLSGVGGRVWADTARLARGAFAALADSQAIEPQALVGPYAALAAHLAASHDVVPYPYDWRVSAKDNAAVLGARLKTLLDTGDAAQPIRILTHGAGGFVFLALLADGEGQKLWTRACTHPGTRAVLLGLPFGGTVHALLPLLKRGTLFEGLAAIDLTHTEDELAAMFAGFKGLVELLPDPAKNAGPSEWFQPGPWSGRTPPAGVDAAFAWRRELVTQPIDWTRILTVAGTAAATPAQVAIDGGKVVVTATPDGDGHSPWSAIPSGLRARTWLADTDHGGLITAKEVRPAIVDLLATGTTRRLGRMNPQARDAEPRSFPLHLPAIPSDAELVAAGLGIGVRPPDVVRPKVRVRVVHGSLSRAASPVVVGHYDQDGFANAEEYLDRQLDGRLSERRQMRLYPGAIGTVAVELRPPDPMSVEHPGAIVVGLGVVGTLTAGALIRTLEEGLTEYGAEKVAEQGRRARDPKDRDADLLTVPAPITSLLVGSGEAGLSLRDSVHALLRGVLGANARLAAPALAAEKNGAASLPLTARIDTLEIVELYEDRAVEALRMLLKLAPDAELAEAFDIEPLLHRGEEGRQRVSFEEPAAWWQRLRVTEHDASIDPNFPTSRRVLKFEAYAERARIDAYAVSSHREKARAFIDSALKTTESSRHVGRTLFEMLVPNAIKDRAPDRRDTVLLLDAAAAAIPWELFEDGLQSDERVREPLAIEAGLIRQLVDEHPRQQVRQATGTGVLVVGNPTVDDTRFADLPGAEREAWTVHDQVASRFVPLPLVGSRATTEAILTALHEKPWRVLHLALHGVFQFPKVAGSRDLVTGAVIARGVYLEPDDFNQMRYVPELVFLNCCHGGDTSGEWHVPRHPELAANLATQFIKMGAKAVVAAGWAVNDAAAETFARIFYEKMLQGWRFGEATHAARRTIYQQFPEYNTWGAYQCYGDPEYVLIGTPEDGSRWAPVWLRELVVAGETITTEAKVADEPGFERLRSRLDTAVQAANEPWLRDARLCVALGAAYGELREFKRAIEYYETARQSERADAALSALEQLANLQARYAEHLWRDSSTRQPALVAEVDEYFAKAATLLEQLVTLHPTAERRSMQGALEKRRAMTRPTTADKVTALSAAEQYYLEAYHTKAAREDGDTFYPFVNALVCRLARLWLQGEAHTSDVHAQIEQLQTFEKQVKGDRGFWSLSFCAEAELLRRLYNVSAQGASVDALTEDTVVELFRKAQKRGRSRREMDSVVTQVRFLAEVAKCSPDPLPALGAALDRLARRLTAG